MINRPASTPRFGNQRESSRRPASLSHRSIRVTAPQHRRADKRVPGVDPRRGSNPFPPETWHEPIDPSERSKGDFRIVVDEPGDGYRHVLTPNDVRERLAVFPPALLQPLQVVHLSRVTRKKRRFPCYGMQWGNTIYLYPVEENRIETFRAPPRPAQQIEARMYGGRWNFARGEGWRLHWTEEAIRDYYLNNILIHELGHLIDDRNSSTIDRERFAEWFAIAHGYLPTRKAGGANVRDKRR
jgi:hypothetical protein